MQGAVAQDIGAVAEHAYTGPIKEYLAAPETAQPAVLCDAASVVAVMVPAEASAVAVEALVTWLVASVSSAAPFAGARCLPGGGA